jgi:hypothetical protein
MSALDNLLQDIFFTERVPRAVIPVPLTVLCTTMLFFAGLNT